MAPLEQLYQMPEEGDHGGVVPPHEAVELAPMGQRWKRRTQMLAGVAVEVPLTAEAFPLTEKCQGDHLTLGQGGPGAWDTLWSQLAFAEIIGHHVKCGQEGVGVDHQVASFFGRFEANYRPKAPSYS